MHGGTRSFTEKKKRKQKFFAMLLSLYSQCVSVLSLRNSVFLIVEEYYG